LSVADRVRDLEKTQWIFLRELPDEKKGVRCIPMKRNATAVWTGSLKDGKGSLTVPGGALKNSEYSFGSRFESGAGTNPEELIAAAHSGCFAMALSATLGEAGITPDRLEVTAEVSLDNVPPKGWTVTKSHLVLVARIPGIDAAKFDELANKAKANCPISRLLNAEITLSAKLS
jgi:lipoyl-dependent peroxiredoxin